MKKLFLFFAASALVVSAVAQKPAVKPTPKKLNLVKTAPATEPATSLNLPKNLVGTSKAFQTLMVGHSANVNGSLVEQCTQVNYEPTTNLVSFSHRSGPFNGSAVGDDIFNIISTDNGATWDTLNKVYAPVSGYGGRYPSAALFNPAGNTDPNNVYSIVAGPGVGSAWDGTTYFGWKKASTPAKAMIYNHGNAKRLDRNFFTVLPSGKFIIGSYAHLDDGTYYTKYIHNFLTGTFDYTNDTIVDLTSFEIAPPYYKHGTDTLGIGNYSQGIAFNKDGSIGYIAFIGMRGDITDPMALPYSRPIVYKTIDQGATWTIQPDFDFKNIPSFKEVLPGTKADTSVFYPCFRPINDVTVDANNNLHIISYVGGTYSIHPDTLGSTYDYVTIEGIFYDTYMKTDGTWDATIIDLQNTKNFEPTGATDLSIDNRLQVGISNDGKKIFYSWVDSDPTQVTDYANMLPDLYVSGRNIDSAEVSDKLNVTEGTVAEYAANNHFMAPQVKENANDFTIYTVITKFGEDQANDPVSYYFMRDVNYSILPVSVNDIDKNIANISNLYPNPTNGLTNVDLSLVKNADVSAQVVNMMGQTVYTQDYGFKTVGMHKLTINATDLTSGIYFVTVKAGNSTSTSKMIVK